MTNDKTTHKKIVIVSAKRSPIGTLGGGLSPLQAHEIGGQVIAAVMRDVGLGRTDISEIIMGQVLTAGAGMNPARQAAKIGGIADEAPAMSINQVCGSGMRALALAAQQIQVGAANIVVAGGQESMSNAPHVAPLRKGKKLGDISLVDSAMNDGLTDAFYGYPMGMTAENIAKLYNITREQQDAFALESQHKASTATKAGRLENEIVTISVAGRAGDIVAEYDEHIRHDADAQSLARLRPVFDKKGTVTAGNASGINDGAAAFVVMGEDEAIRSDIKPLATLTAWAHTGLDPQVMGLGPISASKKALENAGWTTDDVDLWELNEAFAAQSLAVIAQLGLDTKKVNVNGGAIAFGHPIGASGARIVVSLIHELRRQNLQKGVASLCIGGGMGIAVCIQIETGENERGNQ